MRFFILLVIFFQHSILWSAIPNKDKRIETKWISKSGSIRGGLAGMGFSLVDAKSIFDENKQIERLILDIGDYKGGLLKSLPGYYQAEIRDDKLFVDFSQMTSGKIDEALIKKRLKESKFVRNVQMTLDPEDKSLNLAFSLKKNTKIRVFQVAGVKSTSKVVIDFSAK